MRKLVAEAELDKAMLKELARGQLLTPERRRRTVRCLCGRSGVSERPACRVTSQHRSTHRKSSLPRTESEVRLRREMRRIAWAHPRWGWRMAYRLLRRDGWAVNRKRLAATWPNHVWVLDFRSTRLPTADGRRLRLLNIVDENTREALAMRVAPSCDADADTVVAVFDSLVLDRSALAHLRMNKRPRDDRLGAAGLVPPGRHCTGTVYVELGAPWQIPWVEPFNGRPRDELLNVEELRALTEAQVIAPGLAGGDNSYRAQSASTGSPAPSTPDGGPPNTNKHSHSD